MFRIRFSQLKAQIYWLHITTCFDHFPIQPLVAEALCSEKADWKSGVGRALRECSPSHSHFGERKLRHKTLKWLLWDARINFYSQDENQLPHIRLWNINMFTMPDSPLFFNYLKYFSRNKFLYCREYSTSFSELPPPPKEVEHCSVFKIDTNNKALHIYVYADTEII